MARPYFFLSSYITNLAEYHGISILVAHPFGHVGRYEFAMPIDGDVEVLLDGRYHVLEPATEGAIAHSRCSS